MLTFAASLCWLSSTRDDLDGPHSVVFERPRPCPLGSPRRSIWADDRGLRGANLADFVVTTVDAAVFIRAAHDGVRVAGVEMGRIVTTARRQARQVAGPAAVGHAFPMALAGGLAAEVLRSVRAALDAAIARALAARALAATALRAVAVCWAEHSAIATLQGAAAPIRVSALAPEAEAVRARPLTITADAITPAHAARLRPRHDFTTEAGVAVVVER